MGDDIQVVLNPFPDELVTDRVSSTRYAFPTRTVVVEILLLYICCVKGYKDRRRILREEAGLCS